MLQTIAAFDRIGEENAFAVLARATALAAQGKDIINLGIGQPDFRRPTHIVEAAIKALRDGHHGYTPATGILPLREAVARRTLHRRTGVEVSPDSVMILPGGKPTMFAAILMFGEPGAEILYPDPGFPIYRSMIEFTGADAGPGADPRGERLCLLGRGDAGADHAADAAADPQLAGQPDRRRHAARPRSTSWSQGLARIRDVAILSDEIYDVMTYDGEAARLAADLSRDPRPADRAQRLVEDLGDDRLAHGLVDLADASALYDKVRKLAVNCWSCVNAPAQFAGIAAHRRPAGRRRQDDARRSTAAGRSWSRG